MENKVTDHLHQALAELGESELKRFKAKLRDVAMTKTFEKNLQEQLGGAEPAQWVINHFGVEYGAEVTLEAQKAPEHEASAEGLKQALGAYEGKCSDHLETISRVRNLLHRTLGSLGKEELRVFKAKVAEVELSDTSVTNPPIPGGRLERAEVAEMVEELISHYGVRYALDATQTVLRDMNQGALVAALFRLQRAYIKQTWEWTEALFKVSEQLIQIWGSLGPEALENFRIQVAERDQEPESSPIPCDKQATEVTEELIHEYGEERALRMTQSILRSMNRAALAQKLMEASRTEAWRENQCELCPREKDLLEELNPEIIQGPEGSLETYRVHIPRAGAYRCPKTKLRFEVRAAVTICYEYSSWDQYLPAQAAQQRMVAGPLFNIQVDQDGAVAAVHLPHFLCLAGGEISLFQMEVAHFVGGEMLLEKPARVRHFHAVLENPHFSPLGVLWRLIRSKRRVCIHSLVLLYRARRAADITLHLYLLPDDRSVVQAVEEYEKKCQSFQVPKPPLTKPLHYGTYYRTTSNSPNLEIKPKDLEFQRRGPEKHQSYTEVYIQRLEECVELSLRERDQEESVWDVTLRPGDVKPPTVSAEVPAGANTRKTRRDHLVETLKDLREMELKEFKSKLTDTKLQEGYTQVPRGHLEKAESVEVAELLFRHYGQAYATKVAIQVLEAINQRQLAERLQRAAGAGWE
nr:uncharacterized protein LOC102456078 isoform X1 [Pelodiscus sinensis]XP_025037987.1 uncharacterized protein LOC102456078 isoform X2 [Pelodiscus sinensis]|eukprot:XP_006110996.1 uncharacterized protein LOC102456078 isoform X1 [Pelodiscus sinensis]